MLTSLSVAEFDRDEFIHDRFAYRPGEHVTFLAPTQTGKTTLKYELFSSTLTKKLPAVSLIMKPKDDVPEVWRKRLKLQKVQDWPPPWWRRKFTDPPGWMVWPKFSFDPQEDTKRHRSIMRRAILSCYRKGQRILDVDEIYGVADELDLDDELKTVWSKGSSMGCGLWGGSQRPSGIPLLAYSSPVHLFLGNTTDKRDLARYREISTMGIPTELVEDVVQDLGEHEWLYIRKRGPVMCIVRAS
jgi:hypothetical protein